MGRLVVGEKWKRSEGGGYLGRVQVLPPVHVRRGCVSLIKVDWSRFGWVGLGWMKGQHFEVCLSSRRTLRRAFLFASWRTRRPWRVSVVWFFACTKRRVASPGYTYSSIRTLISLLLVALRLLQQAVDRSKCAAIATGGSMRFPFSFLVGGGGDGTLGELIQRNTID